jgi:dTMP kinase
MLEPQKRAPETSPRNESDQRTAGLFIVLEGIEASGKTTQLAMLAEWLERRAIPCIVAREPGGTAVGEAVREVLLHGGHVDPRSELLLYLAARAQLVAETVRPALAAGRVVLTDRYELSTFAYQGEGRGLPIDDVRTLNAFATAGLRPDLTIVLSLSRDEAESRLRSRSGGPDRLERAGDGFHDRVASAYEGLGNSEPGVEIMDGALAAADVHGAVVRLLQMRFPETFARGTG